MKASRFWLLLFLISICTGLAIFGVHSLPKFNEHLLITSLMFFLMMVITVVLFFLANRALQSSNPYSFIRLIIVSIMTKILLVLALIVVYIKLITPDNRLFVLPVLGVYLIYSIFETMVLYRIASTKTSMHE